MSAAPAGAAARGGEVALEARVRRLAHGADLPLPEYESAAAAGLDLRAAVPAGEPVVIGSGLRALVPTGLCLELPRGFEGQVRPRSGLAVHHGVTVLNAPGTIDADYRGEVKVLLVNHGQEAFAVERGMRIAQLVIAPVCQAVLVEAEALSETSRGAGGFGSTGSGVPSSGRAK
ncbi:MAG: dUTP diphosphatase [Rhodobiaceae bacterium]|nr:dUTP diphosphatase [Rhodobiaceae bacterium]